MAAIAASSTAMAAVVASHTAMTAVINSAAARTALTKSSTARTALKASPLAVEVSLVSSQSQYWNNPGTRTLRGLLLYTKAGNTDNAFTITKVDSTTLTTGSSARNAAISGSTGYKDWLEAFPDYSWGAVEYHFLRILYDHQNQVYSLLKLRILTAYYLNKMYRTPEIRSIYRVYSGVYGSSVQRYALSTA